jgi:hypothetical protein
MLRIMRVGRTIRMWGVVIGCLAVFAFATLTCAGDGGEIPGQLQGLLNSYRSKELRELITEAVGETKSVNGDAQAKAAELLLELRNKEISLWLLTHSRARTFATELLNERELSLQDASFILRAMLAFALPSPVPPGGEQLSGQAGAAMHLGEAFCKCLKQDFEQPEKYTKVVLEQWALNVINQAVDSEEVRESKKLQLQLELLRLEVKPDEEQGQPYREKPKVTEPKQDNLLVEERADWLIPVLIVAVVVLAGLVFFLLLRRKK